MDAYHTGVAVRAVLGADSDARWPRFSPDAREAGFASVSAIPMRLRERGDRRTQPVLDRDGTARRRRRTRRARPRRHRHDQHPPGARAERGARREVATRESRSTRASSSSRRRASSPNGTTSGSTPRSRSCAATPGATTVSSARRRWTSSAARCRPTSWSRSPNPAAAEPQSGSIGTSRRRVPPEQDRAGDRGRPEPVAHAVERGVERAGAPAVERQRELDDVVVVEVARPRARPA